MSTDEVPSPTDRAVAFGTVAEEYDRYRPAPPPAALDWMLTGRERVVLDLGAGTGQIGRQLDRPGVEVVAVEPNSEMRAVLARNCPHARVLDGVAEAIPLDAGSVDAVLVGSAWHWFEPEAATGEIARVLRPGGRLGAVGQVADPFVDWVAAMFDTAAEPYRTRARRQYTEVTLPSAAFSAVESHDVRFALTLSPGGIREIFATYSHYLVADDNEKARLDAGVLDTLAARFPGAAAVELLTRAWCWRVERLPVSA